MKSTESENTNTSREPGVTGVELAPGARPAFMTATTITDKPTPLEHRDKYRVAVVFRHPVDAAGFHDRDLTGPLPTGNSGLRIPAGSTTVVLEQPDIEGGELRISLQANAEGRLARAVAELTVTGAQAARRIVTAQLGAVLSRLAFETDGLVAMHYLEVTALSTRESELGLLYAGRDVELQAWPTWQHHANAFFRAAFAVYREGLNSTNAYWAVLCFARVIEGTRQYAAKQSELARARGIDLRSNGSCSRRALR